MPLNQEAIDRLRRAHSVTIAQRDGIASIACHGTAVPSGGLASRLVALLRHDRFEIPVQSSVDSAGNGRRWWPSPSEDLVLDVDDARRDPGWTALTQSLTPGGFITVDWSRDGLTRRPRPDAVRLTTVAPFGTQETFQLNQRKRRASRRQRRRALPLRAAAALIGVALLAASTSAVTTLALTSVLVVVLGLARLAGAPRVRKALRFGRFSFLTGLWSMLPSIAVVVTGAIALGWLWRHRRTIQRIVRFLRGRTERGSRSSESRPPTFGSNGSGRVSALASATGDARLDAVLTHFEKHVANVARMFDHLVPAWHLRVDVAELDPADPADHLLTAAFLDDSEKALDALVKLVQHERHVDFVPCVHASVRNAPCAHLPATQDDSHGAALVQCWTNEVRRRLHASVPA